MAVIDDIVVKLQADISDVKKALKKDIPKAAGKGGEEAGKKFSQSFTKIFRAVAGAAIVREIARAFSDASKKAIEFEKALLGVDAIAQEQHVT